MALGALLQPTTNPLFERDAERGRCSMTWLACKWGGMSVEVRAEISTIYERDDGIHPEVMRQAAEDGKITITAEEHRALLRVLLEELRELRSHQSLSMQLVSKEPKPYIMFPNKELEA